MGWSQQLNGFGNAGRDGQPGVKTPTLDGLAHSGVILNNYYVDTVCSPTRATVLTGRYPIHNTIDDYIHVQAAYGLPLNETTLPSLLKNVGYACHATGKWQ